MMKLFRVHHVHANGLETLALTVSAGGLKSAVKRVREHPLQTLSCAAPKAASPSPLSGLPMTGIMARARRKRRTFSMSWPGDPPLSLSASISPRGA